MNYNFGTKNNWRKQVWKDIAQRCVNNGVAKNKAAVLYLSGEQDLDRRIAVWNGFREDNLLSVDRDADVAAALRARGVCCFHGDFIDVAAYLELVSHIHIDVLFGDYTGILTDEKMYDLIFVESKVVYAFNALRGRDKGQAVFDKFADLEDKHRWRRAIQHLANRMREVDSLPDAKEVHKGYAEEWQAQCSFRSYQSVCGQVFDSIVGEEKKSCVRSVDTQFVTLVERAEQHYNGLPEYKRAVARDYLREIQTQRDVLLERCASSKASGAALAARKSKSMKQYRQIRWESMPQSTKNSIAAVLAWRTRRRESAA